MGEDESDDAPAGKEAEDRFAAAFLPVDDEVPEAPVSCNHLT